MIEQYLPWLLSAITIYMTVLAGNKHRKAWLIGLINQALWLIWIVEAGAWGLLPMNGALWIVYARNHMKWREPEKPKRKFNAKAVKVATINHRKPRTNKQIRRK